MKNFIVILLASASTAFGALLDVTQPGDLIEIVNGVNDGDGNAFPPPVNEEVANAINNTGQKYLNFLDLGSGFAVQPSVGPTIVSALRIYTANDAVQRDPASFELYGGGSLSGPWSLIASGPLALPDGRNPGGTALSIPNLSAFYQELAFANSTSYGAYKLIFPTLKDAAAANSMQIGEVEFLGRAGSNGVPDGGLSAGLFGIALASLAGLQRRFKR